MSSSGTALACGLRGSALAWSSSLPPSVTATSCSTSFMVGGRYTPMANTNRHKHGRRQRSTRTPRAGDFGSNLPADRPWTIGSTMVAMPMKIKANSARYSDGHERMLAVERGLEDRELAQKRAERRRAGDRQKSGDPQDARNGNSRRTPAMSLTALVS